MKIFDMPETEMKKFNKARVDDVEEWYLKKCPKYGPQLSEMLRPYFQTLWMPIPISPGGQAANPFWSEEN